MNLEFVVDNGVLTIKLSGRVDSTNNQKVEENISEILSQNSANEVIIDAGDLEYISSAGLRIMLRLKKANSNFKIINVKSDVYEIFEMTGFTEIMDIKKAYRVVDVDGCEIIGEGSNGIVYRLDPDTVIKVYRNPDCIDEITRERELSKRTFVYGIPTAIPYDVVRVGDGFGAVFELLNAESFAKVARNEPEKLSSLVDEFVKLLKQIHSIEDKNGDLPKMKEVALGWANDLKDELDKGSFEKLVQLIENVKDSNTLLHGDYHFKNVMLQNGEVLLIDLDTLCVGNPVFEMASVYLANVGFGELNKQKSEEFMGLSSSCMKTIWQLTVKGYCEIDDQEKLDDYENKARVIAYTRLLRRTIKRKTEGADAILNLKNKLIEVISQVDSLDMSIGGTK